MPNMHIFGLEFENIIAMFQNSILEFVLLQSLVQKEKSLNFGPKNALFWNFWAGIWKKSYLKSAPSNLSNCKFREKRKIPKYGTKNVWFGYFWARILESYCQVLNQHLRICLIAKFCKETKMLTFRTKNALFQYFLPKLPYLGIFGLEFF